MVILMYIKEKLEKLGFLKITPIQEGVFKAINHKKHLIGLAPTGTGKTHAYLLPILANLDFNKQEVQAVIIVPTNELVIQVHHMLKEIEDKVTFKAYYGGTDKHKELEWLKKYQPQIVIITPSRLNEFVLIQNALKIYTAKYVVLDEADMMFDEAFLGFIDPLFSAIAQAKLLLFSASITKSMQPFINKYFGASDLIDVSKKHQSQILYQLFNIKYLNRLDVLLDILPHINPYLCFIFVSKKENQEEVYQRLADQNYNVVSINSTLGVKQRKKVIEDIRDLRYQYVVTSDLAARGLDFKISHVIHYDLPHHLEFFMHRSGRTGRMYDTGIVITFMTVNDHRRIEKLKDQGIDFINYELTKDGIKKVLKRQSRFQEQDKDAISKIKKPKIVKPNYKKKNALEIKKAKQDIRRKEYAKNR
jgi:ATP-dependent RNA helicase CshB